MRPGHRHDLGRVLPLIRLPEERITLLNAPQPGRLAAGDIVVQMRPAAAPAFLPQHADFLTQADLRAGPHGRIDDLQMAVTMIPAALVEQINHVVTRLHRAVVVAGQNLFTGRRSSIRPCGPARRSAWVKKSACWGRKAGAAAGRICTTISPAASRPGCGAFRRAMRSSGRRINGNTRPRSWRWPVRITLLPRGKKWFSTDRNRG